MSTDHTLLVVASTNVELSLDERSCVFNLDLCRNSNTDDFECITIAEGLTVEQLEQLAVRILHIASYYEGDVDILKRYNIPTMHHKNDVLTLE